MDTINICGAETITKTGDTENPKEQDNKMKYYE
jgi:hypothetical protein